MSIAEKQIAFALAYLARLQNGAPDAEPQAADYGIDYFAAMAIALLVQRLFEEAAMAKARNYPCLPVSSMRQTHLFFNPGRAVAGTTS